MEVQLHQHQPSCSVATRRQQDQLQPELSTPSPLTDIMTVPMGFPEDCVDMSVFSYSVRKLPYGC